MTAGLLLDTNVPSETLRPLPDIRVAEWLERQTKDSQYLSVVTIGELAIIEASVKAIFGLT